MKNTVWRLPMTPLKPHLLCGKNATTTATTTTAQCSPCGDGEHQDKGRRSMFKLNWESCWSGLRTYHKVEFSKAVIMRPTPSYSISAGSLYNLMHFSAGRGCRIRFKLICCYFARGGFLTRLHHREIRYDAKNSTIWIAIFRTKSIYQFTTVFHNF